MESIPFSILMAIVTLYALFGDDIRILTVTKKGDDGFFVMTIICMICFTLEIVLTCICKKEYICNVRSRLIKVLLLAGRHLYSDDDSRHRMDH